MEPDSSITRLQLKGQGQICTDPVADEDFVCETTNMIKDAEGNLVDDFTREDSGEEGPGKEGEENGITKGSTTLLVLMVTAAFVLIIAK